MLLVSSVYKSIEIVVINLESNYIENNFSLSIKFHQELPVSKIKFSKTFTQTYSLLGINAKIGDNNNYEFFGDRTPLSMEEIIIKLRFDFLHSEFGELHYLDYNFQNNSLEMHKRNYVAGFNFKESLSKEEKKKLNQTLEKFELEGYATKMYEPGIITVRGFEEINKYLEHSRLLDNKLPGFYFVDEDFLFE